MSQAMSRVKRMQNFGALLTGALVLACILVGFLILAHGPRAAYQGLSAPDAAAHAEPGAGAPGRRF